MSNSLVATFILNPDLLAFKISVLNCHPKNATKNVKPKQQQNGKKNYTIENILNFSRIKSKILTKIKENELKNIINSI